MDKTFGPQSDLLGIDPAISQCNSHCNVCYLGLY